MKKRVVHEAVMDGVLDTFAMLFGELDGSGHLNHKVG
jgi:hypothetical protein